MGQDVSEIKRNRWWCLGISQLESVEFTVSRIRASLVYKVASTGVAHCTRLDELLRGISKSNANAR